MLLLLSHQAVLVQLLCSSLELGSQSLNFLSPCRVQWQRLHWLEWHDMLGLRLWNLTYPCEVSICGREKGLHLWDEVFLPLRAEDLGFKNYFLALQHEAVGLGPLWELATGFWPAVVRTHRAVFVGRGTGTHSEHMSGQRR